MIPRTEPAGVVRPDPMGARTVAALELGQLVQRIGETIDRAHAAGLAIPPAAGAALETLTCLGIAWTHNANGQPAPLEVKRALGLVA